MLRENRHRPAPATRAGEDRAHLPPPTLQLASALGNHAFGRLLRSLTDESTTAPDEAALGLSPGDRQILAASILPQLAVFLDLIQPGGRRPEMALAVNHLKPVLAALRALAPPPGSETARTIADVVRLLSLWEAALIARVLRDTLTTVATPWAAALSQCQSILEWLREGDAPEHRQELRLLEGSVIPSLRNAIQEVSTPEADLAGVLERNRPTYEAIRTVGQAELQASGIMDAAEQFNTGLSALEALVVGREETLSGARSLTEWAVRSLDALAQGEPTEEPPETEDPKAEPEPEQPYDPQPPAHYVPPTTGEPARFPKYGPWP